MCKFTQAEENLIKTSCPTHFMQESPNHLEHVGGLGDQLVKNASTEYPFTLTQRNEFRTLQEAFDFINTQQGT